MHSCTHTLSLHTGLTDAHVVLQLQLRLGPRPRLDDERRAEHVLLVGVHTHRVLARQRWHVEALFGVVRPVLLEALQRVVRRARK